LFGPGHSWTDIEGATRARACVAIVCAVMLLAALNCSSRQTPTDTKQASKTLIELPVDNYSLEQVDDTGRPIGWAVSPAEAIAFEVEPPEPPIDGDRAIGIKGLAGTQPLAYVALSVKELGPTRNLRVVALGRVARAYQLYLGIQCKVGGQEEKLAWVPWPACGNEWTRLAAEAEVPAGMDMDSVRIVFWYRGGKDEIAFIDDVHAYTY
jgi:hypothetical protein